MTYMEYLNRFVLGGKSGGGYPEPTGTKQITANGEGIDVKDYAEADVAVPNSYSASDEGKVVQNGALVSQTSQNVNQNGTVDTTTKNEVVVNVPNSYAAADEGKVVQNGGLVSQTSQNINSNGRYDTTTKNQVVVAVPSSPAPSGYTLKESSRKIGVPTILKVGSSWQCSVDSTTGSGIAVGDQICLKIVYADTSQSATVYGDLYVWGTVTTVNAYSSYVTVKLTVAGCSLQPTVEQPVTTVNSAGEWPVFGYGRVKVDVPGDVVETGYSFSSIPSLGDYIQASQVYDYGVDVAIFGTYTDPNTQESTAVAVYGSAMSSQGVSVQEVVTGSGGGGGGGGTVLYSGTFQSRPSAWGWTNFSCQNFPATVPSELWVFDASMGVIAMFTGSTVVQGGDPTYPYQGSVQAAYST